MRTSHEDMELNLAAYALGALPDDDRERVDSHLDECDLCRRELAELRDTAAALTLLLPRGRRDPARSRAMRDRLLARARAEQAAEPSSPPAAVASTSRISRLVKGPLTGWAIAAGLAVLLLTHHTFHQPLSFGWLVASFLSVLLCATGAYVVRLRRQLDEVKRRRKE